MVQYVQLKRGTIRRSWNSMFHSSFQLRLLWEECREWTRLRADFDQPSRGELWQDRIKSSSSFTVLKTQYKELYYESECKLSTVACSCPEWCQLLLSPSVLHILFGHLYYFNLTKMQLNDCLNKICQFFFNKYTSAMIIIINNTFWIIENIHVLFYSYLYSFWEVLSSIFDLNLVFP